MTENDKVFYNDGYNLALATNDQTAEKKSVLQTTRQAQDAIDGLVQALSGEAERQNISIDCKKGCSWCCNQPIFATGHEMLFAWEFMKLNFKQDEINATVQRAFDNYQKRGRLGEKELMASKMPCPLLKNGACTIYPARPLTCRIYLSMSEPSCHSFYSNPKADSYPQLFEFPLQAGRMLNEGLNKGLNEKGIHSREMLIEEGLLLAHNNGDDTSKLEINELPLFLKPK